MIDDKEGGVRFKPEDRGHIRAAVDLMWWPIYHTGNRNSTSRAEQKESKLYDSAHIYSEGRGEFRDVGVVLSLDQYHYKRYRTC